MQSSALSHTVWGCGPSVRPDPTPELGTRAELSRQGSQQGVGQRMEHPLPSWHWHLSSHLTNFASAERSNSKAKAKKNRGSGQIQRLKQKKKSVYFRNTFLNVSYSPPPPQQSPIFRTWVWERSRSAGPAASTATIQMSSQWTASALLVPHCHTVRSVCVIQKLG